MAINCSSNALLDTLNAKKNLLNSKVAELQSAGAAAMEDLKAKADAMKDSLLAAIPVPPAIPNFKKELDALKDKVGAELAEAKAAFKERWGDALPDIDIDGMIANATSLIPSPNFDFCKDVPNVEAPKVSADGKVEAVKVKAEEPIVAADIPKKVEVVVPTVVEKEKAPSVSPKIDTNLRDLQIAKAEMGFEIDDFLNPYRKRKQAASYEKYKLTSDKNWEKINNVIQKEGYNLKEYYNYEMGKPAQLELVRQWFVHDIEIMNMNLLINSCLKVNKLWATLEGENRTYYVGKVRQTLIFNYKRLDADLVDDEGRVLNIVGVREGAKILDAYTVVLNNYDAVIKDLRNYKV
jgi:hypothetical protein|tara:strand:+ start:540 stop:1589 length:1050 start_codon:yes stop_codon:yes gene_type:complete